MQAAGADRVLYNPVVSLRLHTAVQPQPLLSSHHNAWEEYEPGRASPPRRTQAEKVDNASTGKKGQPKVENWELRVDYRVAC